MARLRDVAASDEGNRVVHRYRLDGPACGTVTNCNALYAIDDDGRDMPEWVTCQRCRKFAAIDADINDIVNEMRDKARAALEDAMAELEDKVTGEMRQDMGLKLHEIGLPKDAETIVSPPDQYKQADGSVKTIYMLESPSNPGGLYKVTVEWEENEDDKEDEDD